MKQIGKYNDTVDVEALVKACTTEKLCPFYDTNFRCPQTIECSFTKPEHWTKHLEKSIRIRTALEERFPKKK